MSIYIFVLLIGIVAGLRVMTPFAAVSWAAHLGWLPLGNTWLAFLGATVTPYILSFLALGEIINDKLPKTASRKSPMMFGTRIVMGGFCGAALCVASGTMLAGALVGAIGAVIGTLGGYELRTRLARAIGGRDLPIALLEDAVAIGAAILIVWRFA
jgi:uncharacterized membrane protein